MKIHINVYLYDAMPIIWGVLAVASFVVTLATGESSLYGITVGSMYWSWHVHNARDADYTNHWGKPK